MTIPIADQLLSALEAVKSWRCDDYACPQMAKRYNHFDKDGKNIGSNLVNLDVLRVKQRSSH